MYYQVLLIVTYPQEKCNDLKANFLFSPKNVFPENFLRIFKTRSMIYPGKPTRKACTGNASDPSENMRTLFCFNEKPKTVKNLLPVPYVVNFNPLKKQVGAMLADSDFLSYRSAQRQRPQALHIGIDKSAP